MVVWLHNDNDQLLLEKATEIVEEERVGEYRESRTSVGDVLKERKNFYFDPATVQSCSTAIFNFHWPLLIDGLTKASPSQIRSF